MEIRRSSRTTEPPVATAPLAIRPPSNSSTDSLAEPPAVELGGNESRGYEGLLREAAPWMTSLCVNVLFLLVLGLLAMPLLVSGGGAPELFVLPTMDEGADQVESLDTAVNFDSSNAAARALNPLEQMVEQEFRVQSVESVLESSPVGSVLMESRSKQSGMPSRHDLYMPISAGTTPKPLTDRELKRMPNVEGAVDGINGQVRELLGDGDLLVVWLMDASLSLFDDRQRIAARLDSVYAEIEREHREAVARAGKKNKVPILTNAVVAFGDGLAEIVGPSKYSGRTTNVIREIPIDQTGLENVMSAVARCVAKYPSTFKRRTMLVIWTDESGDDVGLLEPTIELCRRANVRVSIVGPTAVLGAQQGTHLWIHSTGQQFILPVMKGPDTALPERLRWPYWWQTQLPWWHSETIQTRGLFQGWYGGDQLFSLSSGFPPYALTRLALQTGGTMTIFDREIDRGPFTLEAMRPYSPDYRSAAEIMEELHYFPLREAVLKSVDVTRSSAPAMVKPIGFTYASVARMRHSMLDYEQEFREQSLILERALTPLANREALEALYNSEPSPRWRAWYDLTYGRLLAQGVRYAEARALFLLLSKQDAIPEEANCLNFAPAPRLITGYQTEERAREAERLLRRCLAKNPNTPWAYLAQRELDYPLGLIHAAYYQEPPPPPRDNGGGGGVPMQSAAPIVPPRL